MHSWCALALAAVFASTAAAETIVIQPLVEADSKDTKIYEHTPTMNFSSNIDVTSADIDSHFQSLLQFNLASTFTTVTAAKIKSATITLYCRGLGVAGGPAVGGDVTMRTILTGWKESAADPGTAPVATHNTVVVTPSIFLGGVAATTNVTGVGFYDWTVTDLVKSWASGTLLNNGVLLSLATGGGDIGFADVELNPPIPGTSPKLTIVADITGPTITPVPTTFLGAGANGTAVLSNFTTNLTVTDDFDAVGAITVEQSPAAATVLELGTHVVTISATDSVGNVSTSLTNVVVSFSDRDPGIGVASDSSATGAPIANLDLPAGFVPTAGTVIAGFSAPAISDYRDITAKATLALGKKKTFGIYYQTLDGSESLLAVQGSPAFGESTFKSFLDPIISSNGSVAFIAQVEGGGLTKAEDDGVWTNAFGNGLELALLEGNPIEGLTNSFAEPILKSVTSISLRDGELLALVNLATGKAGVTKNNDVALIRLTQAGEASVVLREGAPVTAIPLATPVAITDISVLRPALGSNGQGRWHGTEAVVAKVTLADKRTVLLKVDNNGVATPILGTGFLSDAAAEVALNATWKTLSLPGVGGDGDQFAVLGTLTPQAGAITSANDTAIAFSATGALFTTVVQEGDDAPLPVAPPAGLPKFATFFDPVVNDAGDLAFQATVKGAGVTGANKTGLWAGTSAAVQLKARTGEVATGADGSVVVNGPTWGSFLSYALPDGADSGLIFVATLKGGGSTPKDNLGVWAVDSANLVRLIARTGTAGLHPDPTKAALKVTGFTLLTSAQGSYGTARGYNSFGSLAVTATFEDKSQAIIRIDIP